jgi:uncharacterized membrane protein YkvA (DUF1232 family)
MDAWRHEYFPIYQSNVMAFERSRQIVESFRREITVYRRVLRDQRTPPRAKLFLGLAIAYMCVPFDLIPDFIPVIGHLDDAIIVPALVIVALRSLPADLVPEHRELVSCEQADSKKTRTSRVECGVIARLRFSGVHRGR